MSAIIGPMPTTKRRRNSRSSSASLASREDDADGQSADLEYNTTDAKKKKIIKLDPVEQCQQLYDIIRNHKKEDGTVLCESLIRAPKRRQEPAYYEVVSNPIDMLRIQQKIKLDEYSDVEQLSADVDLMVANAKAFYKKPAQEHQDALDLWDLFVDSKSRLFDQESQSEDDKKGKIILKMGKLARRAAAVESRKPNIGDCEGENSESSSTTTNTTDKDKTDQEGESSSSLVNAQLEELFSTVMTATDGAGRLLHTIFQLLPSRKLYPDYYDVIESPIDLKMIGTKIQTGIYSLMSKEGEFGSLSELEKDLLVMFKNAMAYNEPGSQIYKDAKTFKRLVSAKKVEIEQGKSPLASLKPHTAKSERLRSKINVRKCNTSAVAAALKYEDDDDDQMEVEQDDEENVEEEFDEELGEEEEDEENSKNEGDPYWILYNIVNGAKGPIGQKLSDPFKRLPSKFHYPDYYSEIKNPISLAQIKTKMNKSEYTNLSEIQADLNLMFENARKYNRPDSALYKTATKLQKSVQQKFHELNGTVEDIKIDYTQLTIKTNNLESDSDASSLSVFSPNNESSPSKRSKGLVSKIGRVDSPFSVVGTGSVKKEFIPKTQLQRDLRARFMNLYHALTDYADDEGRAPISLFMEKPSKKLYPDYYQIIVEPIDMITIESNIKNDKYLRDEEILADFKLMFKNCRTYNEEGSLIYEDANVLEKVLQDKVRGMGPEPGKPKPKKVKRSPGLTLKQKSLLDTIREYKDKNGRVLSAIFQRLPSKIEYPQYYDIIKNPIDLDRICNKQQLYKYDTLEALSADLLVMFDNACKFNEPDSQIYKDALTLHQLVIQTKLSLAEDETKIPDVSEKVKEILSSIFTSLYNHSDEEGRCYSDTFSELPEFDEVDGVKEKAPTLDVIKSRLDRGFYKRLDVFQKDMFIYFERARKLSRSDSQLFEDSIELHSFFIRTRDLQTGNGQILKSPALNYTIDDLNKSVEILREEKKLKEIPILDEDSSLVEESEKKGEEESAAVGESKGTTQQSEMYNEQTYNIGDFVYISIPGVNEALTAEASSNEQSSKKNIAIIQKLWTEPDGTKMLEGIWFFRPDQTYHVPTRKFLQKEVFRSEVRSTAKLSEIGGKCYVMTVKGKEYFNYAPDGFKDEDVYVCEYRYSSRCRSFTKMKYWAFYNQKITLTPRPKPLEPIRVSSVFSERVGNQKESTPFFEEDLTKIHAEALPNVTSVVNPPKEGFTYYEQYNLPFGIIRVGDYVYVRVENAKKLIARIDSCWLDHSTGNLFFHGPWFNGLSEVHSSAIVTTKLFYKQEVFQSSIEDTNPLLSICDVCKVYDVEDYLKVRPTEMNEDDIWICESLYDEARREIKKLDGLKKYVNSNSSVHQDELYYFRRPISIVRVDYEGNVVQEPVLMPKLKLTTPRPEPSPLSALKSEESHNEDSLDSISPPSLSDYTVKLKGITPNNNVNMPKKVKTPGKKLVTGYILYSSEVRRKVADANQNSSFGEISRIVGDNWKKKTPEEKSIYEERAKEINEEKGIAYAAAVAAGLEYGGNSNKPKDSKSREQLKQEAELATVTNALKRDPDWIFECLWAGCDNQFEDALDLIEHCTQEPRGHVCQYFKEKPESTEFQCSWKNCGRVNKKSPPFPTLSRLVKHVKDIHILKGNNGRIIHLEMRRGNCKPSSTNRYPKSKPVIKPTGKNKPSFTSPNSNAANTNAFMMPGTSSQLVSNPEVQVQMQQQQQQVFIRQIPQPPPEPLFVTVPPRPQKLVHSEAYIRYIESLHNEQKYMTNWEKTLKATKDNTPTQEPSKLPKNWLANGEGNHGSVSNALWALRDFMTRDALNLRRVLE